MGAAVSQPGRIIGFLTSSADYSSSGQFTAVKVNSSGQVVQCGTQGEVALGVLQNAPKSGQAATVMVDGVTKMVAAGSIAAGALVTVDSQGRAVAANKETVNTSDAGASADPVIGSNVLGICIIGAGAAGSLCSVAILHVGGVATTAS